MSKRKEIIEIYPPVGMSYMSARTENLKSKIVECNICHGVGGKYYNEHASHVERWEECEMCKGTGQIQASICIDWQSVGQIKDQFKNKNNE